MTTPYTLKKLTDVEDSAVKFGFSERQEAHFAKDALETTETGVSFHRVKAGQRQAFGHKHDHAEEVYVVVAGSGRIKLDDEIIDIRPLDSIRMAPGVTRMLEAGDDGLEVLAFGPRHEDDAEMVQGFWEE